MFSVEMVRCLNKRRLFMKPSSGLLLVLLVCIHLFASYYQYTYQFPFDMDSQPSAKREGKANFSNVEVMVLLDVYRQHQVRLNAQFSSVITHRLKTALWLEVATAVSACGHSMRPVSKKWTSRWLHSKPVPRQTGQRLGDGPWSNPHGSPKPCLMCWGTIQPSN